MNSNIDYKIPSVTHHSGGVISLRCPLCLHIVVSLQRAEEISQTAADTSVYLWNSSTPMKREVNTFLFADSMALTCFARCPLFGFAAELRRETSQGQPLIWASFHLSSSELQEFNWFLHHFFDSCSMLSHFISSWCMRMTQRGNVSAFHVGDINGTLRHWFL